MLIRPARFPVERGAVIQLIERVVTTEGVAPIGEVGMIDVEDGPAPGSFGFVADGPRMAGYIHVMETRAAAHFTSELAIDLRHREDGTAGALLAAAIEEVAARAGRKLGVWTHSDQLADVVAAAGFAPQRMLYRLDRTLPPDQRPAFPAGVTVRGFRRDRDEPAWLEVNNAAFAGHPEQGGWSLADLRLRLDLDWFDPDGVRMAWQGERLAAFNWTKVHPGRVGEIFVIAVAPGFQGMGLGKAIALEGLWDLWSRRSAHRAMLYVDAANDGAVELYRRLGFTIAERHRFFERDVDQVVA